MVQVNGKGHFFERRLAFRSLCIKESRHLEKQFSENVLPSIVECGAREQPHHRHF